MANAIWKRNTNASPSRTPEQVARNGPARPIRGTAAKNAMPARFSDEKRWWNSGRNHRKRLVSHRARRPGRSKDREAALAIHTTVAIESARVPSFSTRTHKNGLVRPIARMDTSRMSASVGWRVGRIRSWNSHGSCSMEAKPALAQAGSRIWKCSSGCHGLTARSATTRWRPVDTASNSGRGNPASAAWRPRKLLILLQSLVRLAIEQIPSGHIPGEVG